MRGFAAALLLALLAGPAAGVESSRIQTVLLGPGAASGELRTRFGAASAVLRLRVRGLAPRTEYALLAKNAPADPSGAEILHFFTGGKGSARVSLDLAGDEAGAPVDPRGCYLVVADTGGAEALGAWLFGDFADDGPDTKTAEATRLTPGPGAPGRVDARYGSRTGGSVSFELIAAGVAPGSYDLFVDGLIVQSFVADGNGRARLRFANPVFEPRRRSIELRQGASVIFAGPLLAQLPSLVATPSLSVEDVETVIAQAVAEALRLDTPAVNTDAVIAVVDRVGNVLAIWRMPDAPARTVITSNPDGEGRDVTGGLEGLRVKATFAAISKAGTAAYLSSRGNAFTTRTASQIVQQNFNPGEDGRPGGPLFGVQFSQLPCGDLVRRLPEFPTECPTTQGPKRLPLGFSGDSGGLPLYIRGVPVGGVGVEADNPGPAVAPDPPDASQGVYTADPRIFDHDEALEERIATAATRGFEAPADIRADRIAVDGRYLRFADDERAPDLPVPDFATLPGGLVDAVPFTAPCPCTTPQAGTPFLTTASGIVATTQGGLPAEQLVDATGAPAYPATASKLAGGLTKSEVNALLTEALRVAERSRAQIRRPIGSKVRVSISVADSNGEILGIIRGRDAPLFGIDVSLQKARAAAFFSSPNARAALLASPQASYVSALDAFLDEMTLIGNIAFSNRAIGNLARPFFPDGINSKSNGPLSLPFDEWSPFSTGLQLDLVAAGIAAVVIDNLEPLECTSVPGLANGIQIFPGSVPIYRDGELIGGIGVSGDGVDQDDMVAFLGLHQAGEASGTIANAPRKLRADSVGIDGVQLRYVNCPVKPFLDSREQTACSGK
jgi:uncharacterized protein GlcG (DUF336 family)